MPIMCVIDPTCQRLRFYHTRSNRLRRYGNRAFGFAVLLQFVQQQSAPREASFQLGGQSTYRV